MFQSQNSEQAWRILVLGVVQGVGYRRFVQRAALRRNYRGWTRNLSNGSVEILLQGESRHLDSFLSEIRKGPPGAQVTQIDAREVETSELQDFVIQRDPR